MWVNLLILLLKEIESDNTIKIDNNYVNYYEISNTEDCIFIYDKISSNNSYINTIFSYNLKTV